MGGTRAPQPLTCGESGSCAVWRFVLSGSWLGAVRAMVFGLSRAAVIIGCVDIRSAPNTTNTTEPNTVGYR